jgi:hypothetical protein
MRRAIPLTVVLASLAAAAPAGAAWQPAQTLARGSAAYTPATASGQGGRFAVAWLLGNSRRIVQVARMGGSGRFGAPLTLDASTSSVDDPALAFEPDGRLDVVWRRAVRLPGRTGSGSANHRLWYRRVATSGALGQIEHLTGAGESAYDPLFAVAPAGADPVLTWSRRTDPSWTANFVRGHAVDRRRLPGGGIFDTFAAQSADGGVLLTWIDNGVKAAYRPAGSTSFGPTVRIASGTTRDPRPVFYGDRMAVAFSRYEGGTYRLRVAVAPAGGAFAASHTLTGADETALNAVPVGLAGGELEIPYVSRAAGAPGYSRAGAIRMVRVDADGAQIGAARLLDRTAKSAVSLHAAADGTSGAFAAWWAGDQVRAVRIAPGGIVGTMRRLTSGDERASRQLSLSAGVGAEAVVAWTTNGGAARAAAYR